MDDQKEKMKEKMSLAKMENSKEEIGKSFDWDWARFREVSRLDQLLASRSSMSRKRHGMNRSRTSMASSASGMSTTWEYVSLPLVKQQAVLSDRTKLQAEIIQRLVEEQERETMEKLGGQQPSSEATEQLSETFDQAMQFIQEQTRKEPHNRYNFSSATSLNSSTEAH